MKTNEPRSPVWQSIHFLPLVLELFGAQLREAQITYDSLASGTIPPYVMGDATLARARQVFREQREFLAGQREQVLRWQSETITPEHCEMLVHLTARADRLSVLYGQIFALIDELSQGTTDRIMGMSDGVIPPKNRRDER